MRDTFLYTLLVLSVSFSSYAEIAQEDWYERMREPWVPEETGFIRDWLIIGEFPNPPNNDKEFYDHTEPCVGCDTDYLKENGGEAGIRPVEGMTHTRPDGSVATWFAYSSPEYQVDFVKALEGRPHENTIAYAYTTIEREEAGSARLTIGSDDGIMVWVNGELVHRNILGRAVVKDNDLLLVDLIKGINHVLVKVEQGEFGWAFCARLLDEAALIHEARPGFLTTLNENREKHELVVQTDFVRIPDGRVTVDVIGPGGSVVASQTVTRGDKAVFNTRFLPNGPYDIRCIMPIGLGRSVPTYHQWYKGDIKEAVLELLQAGEDADEETPRGMVTKMLADLVNDRTEGGKSIDLHQIHSSLIEFEELKLEKTGKGSRVHSSGFIRMAWRDEIDGSVQFCRVYLPHDYTPDREWPVVIYLHGYNPENPPYIHWWAIDQRHAYRADAYGVIYIEPHGRANTGYRGIGEADVLRGLQKVKELLPVDEERVYLTGESMGGGGTWHVGTRNPELFAAISPVYGGWDYRQHTDTNVYDQLTDYEHFRAQAWSSTANAEALLTTPVFVHHGDNDRIVDIDSTRFLVRELQRWQYNVRYAEYPGGTHFGGMNHWDNLMPWLLSHRLNRHPEEVRVRSMSLKDASAHWVRVEQIENYHAPIHVRAKRIAKNTVELKTENVLSIRLSPGGPDIDTGKPLRVLWNDTLYMNEFVDGAVVLNADGYSPAGLIKRPELAGPIDEVKKTPFAFIVGTSSTNDSMNMMCAQLGDDQVATWYNWQKAMPRIFKDTEVTDEVLASCSLVLIGDAEANSVTRRLGGAVPLVIDGDTVQIYDQAVDAPDAAVQMIYPSPWSTDRYVHVMAATSAKGMFHHVGIPDELDFCVHDGRYIVEPEKYDTEDIYLLAGTFDGHWRLNEQTLFEGDPDTRAACVVPYIPSLEKPTSGSDVLYLSELIERNRLGGFRWLQRNVNKDGEPIEFDGVTYESGITVYPGSDPGSAEWEIGGEEWQSLKAVIGVVYGDEDKVTDLDKENTRVVFKVLGDGKELFVSEPFAYGDPVREIDVPVGSVTTLQLVVHNEAPWSHGPASASWADLHLRR